MQPNTPNSTSITLERKKAHSDQITSIAISATDPNVFATSSEDSTLRIWDLRINSSIKLVKYKQFTQQLSNCTFSNSGSLLVGCGKRVYSFELRKQQVFITEPQYKGEPHLDDINHIAFDKTYTYLGACDDMGDTKLYNSQLQTKKELDQKHTNISFCLDFINPQGKPPVCVTSGFDCKLVFWNTETEQAIREIQITPIFSELVTMYCPPLIYCVLGLQSSVLVGTETGYVACFNLTGPKKPRLLFSANLNKILRMCFANFKKNILLTLNGEQSFTLFDYDKRNNLGAPTLISKYATTSMPNWIETTQSNCVLIGDKTSELSIYRIKG